MKIKHILPIILITAVSFISSCANDNVHDEKMTIAKAQTEIKKGMTSAEVVEIMGSPNMVTTDDEGRETWVYDKVSTNTKGTSSKHWLAFWKPDSEQTSSSNQRTLTIIIKFDNNKKVRDVAYRTSTF